MSTMTTATFHHRKKPDRPPRPKIGRTSITVVDVIAASAYVLRPVSLGVGLLIIALALPSRAHADPANQGSTVLNTIGIGNNGPISSAISEVGTSFCPMLVQPGSALASNATQMTGNGGLAPPIAGWVVGMAIQSQCPAVMNAMANGDFSMLTGGASMLTGGATPGLPLGLPGAQSPLGLPGAQSPLGLPGAASNPLGVPGL